MKRSRPEKSRAGVDGSGSKRRHGEASVAAAAKSDRRRSEKRSSSAPRNALRSAQLEKRELLLFRKFGHGPRLFARYYRAQRLAPPREFAETRAAFATSLPITFRVHVSRPDAREFAKRLLAPLHEKGLIASIPWMPPGEGWRAVDAAADAKQAGHHRKLHPEVAAAVARGVDAGVCARQEAVSMLPVLALSPRLRAGDRVLDVCAAPGNKTMQLLERVAPTGLVVANDGNPRRVDTLREALARHRRAAGETASLVVTCAMGQDIPVPAFGGSKTGASEGAGTATRGYDAVLADVPCSGDGTLRKDPDVLKRWHPGLGNALHATQVAVARNAAALVRPGGVLLYSTCSLNPVEDEAVVAAVLLGPGGERFELVRDPLGAGTEGRLKHRPGVSEWRVGEHVTRGTEAAARSLPFATPRDGEDAEALAGGEASVEDARESAEDDSDSEEDVTLRWYATREDAVAAGMPCAAPTMWPPHRATKKRLHLDRCARFLPHDQDTGGFFVAMLRRREDARAEDAATREDSDEDRRRRRAEKTERTARVRASAAARATADLPDPVRPLPPGEAEAIAAKLGVGRSTRARFWLGAKGDVTLAPAAAPDLAGLGGVAIAAAGVVALRPRVLTRDEGATAAASFPYDFTVDGAEVLAPRMRARRVRVAPTDLQAMLAARARGVDVEEEDQTSFFSTGKGEILRLTPDEMADATRDSWRRAESSGPGTGAVALVLVRRGDDKAAPASVAFAVPGRCDEKGLSVPPEVDAESARRLLARLREVAGASRKPKK